MARAPPSLFSANARKESPPGRTSDRVRPRKLETGSKSDSQKSLWFRRSPRPNEKRHQSANAVTGPSIVEWCKPRPARKTACRRKTKCRCASETKSAGHLSRLSMTSPNQARVPEFGDSRGSARLPSDNGSRPTHRPQPLEDQTSSVPSADRTSVGRRLAPAPVPAEIPDKAP